MLYQSSPADANKSTVLNLTDKMQTKDENRGTLLARINDLANQYSKDEGNLMLQFIPKLYALFPKSISSMNPTQADTPCTSKKRLIQM